MDEGRPGEERPSLVFWIVVAATAFYLVVRVIQGVVWVLQRLV